ncbi:hypothetical protein HMPREF1633_00510 [Tissierellia bacterium S5-A11]|nr:hypothetical protein HMPREF1633_00510 [Tissierellia bacterium S5-A11]
MKDCIFCQIANGTIPSSKVFENDDFVAFNDLAPTAPVHVLVVPKQHVQSINQITDDETEGQFAHFFSTVQTVASQLGLTKNGYRVVINTGADGGQTVPHFHAHIIGGKALGWPPFAD